MTKGRGPNNSNDPRGTPACWIAASATKIWRRLECYQRRARFDHRVAVQARKPVGVLRWIARSSAAITTLHS